MAKFLYIAVVYFVIGLSLAHFGNEQHWYSPFLRPFLPPATICGNNITETAYMNQILTVINNCQANATCNAVLQLESSTFVAYVKNPVNQALLYSNCTAFVAGVQAAKSADRGMECKRKQIAENIERQIDQVAHNVTGSNGRNVLDSKEDDHHHSVC